MTFKVALPDLVSNSYFPAIAAVELGHFKEENIDAEIELIFPVPESFAALREGRCDFVAGSAHAPLWAFPRWEGSKVLCALSQGMYWFLVLRHDINVKKGDVNGLKGLRLGAAPGVDVGLRQLLIAAGIDADAENITIGLPPGGIPEGKSFGVVAAQALIDGVIDGFWWIYPPHVNSEYMVVNQIEKDKSGNIWVVNPFCERYGHLLAIQSVADDSWSHVNIPDSSSFRPQTIDFDNSRRAWIGFAYRYVWNVTT